MRWLDIGVGADVAAIVAAAMLFEPRPTLIVRALAALLPIIFRGGTARRRARIWATVLLTAYALVGLMTAGLLFLPASFAMGMAASRVDAPALGESKV